MAEEKSPKLRKGFSWYAWVNSGCGFGTQLICLYCTMVWGYCIAAVATQLGVEKTDLALAASIYGVCYAGLSFVWGIMADRIGLRKTLTVSLAGVGVFLVLFSFTATSVMGVIITYALVGVFVSALGSAVLPKLISTWFHANTRSRGMMIAGFGGSAASLTAGLIFPQLLLSFGWQMCFQVLGVIALVVCVIVFLLVRDSPYSVGTYPYGMTEQEGLAYVEAMEEQQGDVKDGKGKPSFKDVLKSPVTWGFGVIMVLFQFYMMSTTTYRTAAIVDSGFTIVEAGLVGTIMSVTMLISQAIAGVAADKVPRKFVAAVLLLVGGVGFAAFDFVFGMNNVTVLYVYAFVAGLFFGVAPILNTLMAECFPPELRGSGPGVVSTIALVGRFFGPIIAAQCIVMAGGHTGAFTYFAGGSLLVAGILVLIILPKTGGKVGDPIGKKG